MPVRARLSRFALNDLNEATRWIGRDSPAAARGLREAVRRAAVLIAEHPEIGFLRPEIVAPPRRLLVVRGFPYLLVYDPALRPPSVLRVVHGARDLPEVLRDLS
jgi:toxin ParE1/3/4